MDKIERNELYTKYGYKPQNLCIKPFCFSEKIPGQLGLCCDCTKDLQDLLGMKEIFDYTGLTPTLKITPKEAVELLIQYHKGSFITRLRFEHEPCYSCSEKANSNPQKVEKLNVQQSEKKA
jgi:hypothetical protein